MNVKLCSLFVFAAALSLPGCRTTDGSARYVPAAKSVPAGSTYAPQIVENREYVAYVENVARRRGVTVRWVNKPVRRDPEKR